ncbi:hypothetical protein DM860_001644 [Cuscuta australis]|uniref:S-protein homolog n=1 Tax=Cuscuta australis TaxID=267555 RepID=A0A328EAW5_9ASTE|nr:hypothetical protein DM860_001644 [Cuscuta australis]
MVSNVWRTILILAAIAIPSFAQTPTVTFTNRIVPDTPQPPDVKVSCLAAGGLSSPASFDLLPGRTEWFQPETMDAVYQCSVVWGRFFVAVKGFDAARDDRHAAVSWVLDKRGISVSYDRENWELVKPWHTK